MHNVYFVQYNTTVSKGKKYTVQCTHCAMVVTTDQAGGVLQVAGKAQHAASPWLGQVQAEGEEGEQLRASDLNNSVVSVISRLRYVVSSNIKYACNKCDERTGILFTTCADLFTICMCEHNFGISKNL